MCKKIFSIAVILLQISCLTSSNSSLFGKDCRHDRCYDFECCECDCCCEVECPACIIEVIPGPPGPRGPRGYKGNEGPTGQRGEEGPRGHRGHKGQCCSPIFAFRYTPFLEPIEVSKDSNVPFIFENTAPVGPIVYDTSTNEFVFGKSGYFEISYGISQDTENVTVALFLNETEIPGSRIYVAETRQLVSATIITRILKNEALSLKNTGNGPTFNLSSVIPGSNDAFITISELSKIP